MVNGRGGVGYWLVGGLAALAALLAACDPVSLNRSPDPFEAIRNTDLQPRFPQQSQSARVPSQAPSGASFFGREETFAPAAPTAQAAPSGEGFELNFENAPVTTVAKVILGDILQTGYTIDPRIQGTVTIASGRPVPRGDLLFVLENALRMSNVVLVPDNTGYRLIPAGEAPGSGRLNRAAGGSAEGGRASTATPGSTEPGYGITVVPLHFASAQTILRLIDSFAIKPGVARADPARNLIMVQGSGPERRAAVETILSFDVDWMRGQSVGIYPVQNAAPEAMITELEKVMETGEGGINQNLVKLQPVARLNAILVVTRQPNLLRTASTWIKRLDKANTAGAGVRVYRMKYGDARQVALLLNSIFGGGSASGLDSAANQIAPGAGVTSTSSGLGGPVDVQPATGIRAGGGIPPVTDPRLAATTPGGTQTTLTSPGAVMAGRQGAAGAAPAVVLPGVRITADVVNNSLVIFANQENYRLIEQTLNQLDRPQLQVAIHATIAEITLNNELRYGVQYFIKSSDVGYARDRGSFGLMNSATQAIISRALPGFNLLLGPEADPRFILDALRGVTDVKVLSTPSVVVIDNQVATLQVGDQVPIATQSATILTNPNTPLVNTIDYRNTGVILRVIPRINVNGNVILDIEQEISNVSQAGVGANTLTPTVSQRKVKSSIAVASGQSVLLGGLISERQERGRHGIPILEEIPVLGEAFSRNTRTTNRTELIIFIQPQIIRDSVDAYKVAEELRVKLRGSAETAFPPGPSLRKDPLFVR